MWNLQSIYCDFIWMCKLIVYRQWSKTDDGTLNRNKEKQKTKRSEEYEQHKKLWASSCSAPTWWWKMAVQHTFWNAREFRSADHQKTNNIPSICWCDQVSLREAWETAVGEYMCDISVRVYVCFSGQPAVFPNSPPCVGPPAIRSFSGNLYHYGQIKRSIRGGG